MTHNRDLFMTGFTWAKFTPISTLVWYIKMRSPHVLVIRVEVLPFCLMMGIADLLINAGKVREVAWPECRVAKLEAWLWLGCAEEASAA